MLKTIHDIRLALVALALASASCSGGSDGGDTRADARADAPLVCPGENPATRCRSTATECLPSACGCSSGTWVCTADCGGGRDCRDAGGDARGPERLCLSTGGAVTTALCCRSTVAFPDTCTVGACGCAPENSHPVAVCSCPAGSCYSPERGCLRR